MPRAVLRYIELKTGYSDDGPAWIDLVIPTKSGRGIYFQNKLLLRRNVAQGNHVDSETGQAYWVSGPKKDQQDRHRYGGGPVEVTTAARAAYKAYLSAGTESCRTM